MPKITRLPPANGLTGRYMTKQGHYDAYRAWRYGAGYKIWRDKQWQIQKGRCYYCKVSLRGRKTNVEHVVAQSRGGLTVRKNLVLSCPDCNKRKGSSEASAQLIKQVEFFNASKRKKIKRKAKETSIIAKARKDYRIARSRGLI